MTKDEVLRQVEEVIAAGPYSGEWQSLCGHKTPGWYERAKFGVFIHWGAYSVPAFGNEWYPRNMYVRGSEEYEHHRATYGDQKDFGYKDFIKMFRGERFDAGEWMSLFREAGAKYVMPVAEHHDGFQMYESSLSKWNAKNMGPCRDVIGELKNAADREGIAFCVSNHRAEHFWFFNEGTKYESDVSGRAFNDFYCDPEIGGGEITHDIYAAPPSKSHCEDWLARNCELVDKYRPKVVWFDWWIHNAGFKPYLKKFAAYYYNRAAAWGEEVAINYKYRAFPPGAGIFDVERGQLAGIRPLFWQTDTSTARNSWCYTENNTFKSPEELTRDLVDIVSKNGCLLLNVGPKPDGTITDEDKGILLSIGKWLAVNGEAVYGATHWERFGEGPTNIAEGGFTDGAALEYTEQDFRFTYRGGVIYAFAMKYPEDGRFTVKSFGRGMREAGDFHVREAKVLGYGYAVSYSRDESGMHFTVGGTIKTDYPVCLKIDID